MILAFYVRYCENHVVRSVILGRHVGGNYENVAKFWISNNKNVVINMVSTAFMWTMWKHRNDIFFRNCLWYGMPVWVRLVRLLKRWLPLCPTRYTSLLEKCIVSMEKKMVEAPALTS
jgi:hypothetical protein